jgi:hypothetical protein
MGRAADAEHDPTERLRMHEQDVVFRAAAGPVLWCFPFEPPARFRQPVGFAVAHVERRTEGREYNGPFPLTSLVGVPMAPLIATLVSGVL